MIQLKGTPHSKKGDREKMMGYMAQVLLLREIIMKTKQQKLGGLGLVALLFVALPSTLHAYDEIVVKDGAKIHGAVKVEGKLPKLPPLQISKYKEVCKDVPNESLIVGPAQGLRYAVVTLEGVGKGKAVEKETVHELDNIKCRFSPHVQAASVGQFVVIKNSDPILHTAHALFTNEQPQFNVGLYPGRVIRKPLIAAGIVKIGCEVHPWMTAYIAVAEHPYHTISDIYGEYELTDIPPGTYQLKVWHESLGTQEKRIEVKPAAAQKVDFTFTPSPGVKK
jgi:hypothetical protein